jgi:hypothetical protein
MAGLLVGLALLLPAAALAEWLELEPGLELGRFDSRQRAFAAGGDLTVLRAAPDLFSLRLLTMDPDETAAGRSLTRWCADYNLLAAINAGMYQEDRRTHVGFCQADGQVLNGFANNYRSAAAFDPVDPSLPPFRIFDLDEIPLKDVARDYGTVVQNLRLIKREGENRWQPGTKQWREAALAEDRAGRILLVNCRTAWSMQEFNEILLALPLEVVAAQHLEGRGQARFRLRHPAHRGGAEDLISGPALPNVFGIVRRGEPRVVTPAESGPDSGP